MKVFLIVALTTIAWGFVWCVDRALRVRRARRELRRRRLWWRHLRKAYELADDAEDHIYWIG